MTDPAERIESAARADLEQVERLLSEHLAAEFHHPRRDCKKCRSLRAHKGRCEFQLTLLAAGEYEDVPLF